jgi:hypothetical protein
MLKTQIRCAWCSEFFDLETEHICARDFIDKQNNGKMRKGKIKTMVTFDGKD